MAFLGAVSPCEIREKKKSGIVRLLHFQRQGFAFYAFLSDGLTFLSFLFFFRFFLFSLIYFFLFPSFFVFFRNLLSFVVPGLLACVCCASRKMCDGMASQCLLSLLHCDVVSLYRDLVINIAFISLFYISLLIFVPLLACWALTPLVED